MAGYSGTPLAKKLGLNPGARVYLDGAPEHFRGLLDPVPEGVEFLARAAGKLDVVHVFTTAADHLAGKLQKYRPRVEPDGMIWVSWPKKAAKVATDVTEDVVRELALPLGLVDVKVCAVDDVWSGLKLVIRRELRA